MILGMEEDRKTESRKGRDRKTESRKGRGQKK